MSLGVGYTTSFRGGRAARVRNRSDHAPARVRRDGYDGDRIAAAKAKRERKALARVRQMWRPVAPQRATDEQFAVTP